MTYLKKDISTPESEEVRSIKGASGSDIENRVIGVIAKYLGDTEKTIKLESNLGQDLDLDSLGVVEIAMALEEEFEGLEISDDDMSKIKTVRDVTDYIAAALSK